MQVLALGLAVSSLSKLVNHSVNAGISIHALLTDVHKLYNTSQFGPLWMVNQEAGTKLESSWRSLPSRIMPRVSQIDHLGAAQ